MKDRKILFALIFAFIAVGFLAVVMAQAFDTHNTEVEAELPITRLGDDPINKDQLTKTVNNWKVLQGKTPYIESEFLCDIAETRVVEVQTTWSHEGFLSRKYCENCTIGENLSRGAQTSGQTLNNWLNSKGHRTMLERDYTHACIATDGSYAVQIFGYY